MPRSAMELSLALNLSYAMGALEALGQKNMSISLRGDLDAILEQAWADEAERQHEEGR